MRRILPVLLVVLMAACGGDTTTAPETSTTATDATTTTTMVVATTTLPPATVPTATTTTEAPPPTETDPEMAALAGLWRESGTFSWYLLLSDHGVITTGDSPATLSNSGAWTIRDGDLVVWNLQYGTALCGEAEGIYAIDRNGDRMTLTLVDDPCEGRRVLFTRDGRKTYILEP